MDSIENSFVHIDTDQPNQELGMFALFLRKSDAYTAIRTLEKNGVTSEDISLLAPQKGGTHDFVYSQTNSLIQGALIGGAMGGILIGLVGLFFGTKGLVTSPSIDFTNTVAGIGLYPISAAVTSILGLIFGAASGVLVGIGSPKSAAKRYGFYLKEGGIVLVVHLKNKADRLLISRILEKNRGQDINILEQSKIWNTIIPEKNKLVYQ